MLKINRKAVRSCDKAFFCNVLQMHWSSHLQVFRKKGVLLTLAFLLKTRLWHRCFSVREFWEIFEDTHFREYLRTNASGCIKQASKICNYSIVTYLEFQQLRKFGKIIMLFYSQLSWKVIMFYMQTICQ